ncbi:MAG: signal peptide peptidase SppA [Pirellulales bacterium]
MITTIAVIVAVASAGANATYFQTDSKVLETFHSRSTSAQAKVAILTISGAILGGDGFASRQIDKLESDTNVRAVVLRIDSPGGTVSGSDELYHRLTTLATKREIPIVVSMGGIAASGGYYIAMASGGEEDVIFAEPATLTGSVGVLIPNYDFSQLLERFDISDTTVSSGPMKEMLSPTKSRGPELEEQQRAVLQSLVDEMFDRFASIVRQGRPKITDEQFDVIGTGRIFTAQQAVDVGLVDRLGFLDDAVARAVELTGLTDENVRVVRYAKTVGLLDEVLGSAGTASARIDSSGVSLSLDALAEWTAPRCWYLCSWLPPVVGR